MKSNPSAIYIIFNKNTKAMKKRIRITAGCDVDRNFWAILPFVTYCRMTPKEHHLSIGWLCGTVYARISMVEE